MTSSIMHGDKKKKKRLNVKSLSVYYIKLNKNEQRK